tara:strand:- start:321 stop:527 length:207 start_codon:yes stop_codon:yes gene_type:complete
LIFLNAPNVIALLNHGCIGPGDDNFLGVVLKVLKAFWMNWISAVLILTSTTAPRLMTSVIGSWVPVPG